MIFDPAGEFSAAQPRVIALASAIVLRDCSLQPQTPPATRKVCRDLMREQALRWRRPRAAGVRCTTLPP